MVMSGCVPAIGQIEIDLAADEVIDDDVFARRTEAQRALVFEDVAGVLEFLQIAFVDFVRARFEIRTEISAHLRAFIPIESEPLQAIINCGRRFFECCASDRCLRCAK